MKKLVNLKGVKTLGKAQQKTIFGGEGSDTIGGGGGGVYCRCVNGTEGGFLPNCQMCENICSQGGYTYICVG